MFVWKLVWEELNLTCLFRLPRVLILVCVEVSVGEKRNYMLINDYKKVLILVCVEVSVGVTEKKYKYHLRTVLILVCVEVSVGVS